MAIILVGQQGIYFLFSSHIRYALLLSHVFSCLDQIFVARDTAAESKDLQDDLWFRISKDEYMRYAVEECYHSIKVILMSVLDKEGQLW